MPKRPTDSYAVGYGRPPLHTRFASGESGNPRGRPRGSRNLKTDVLEEVGEKVAVREGHKSRSISKQRAVVKSVVLRALKGDARAVATLVTLLLRFQESVPADEAPVGLAAEDRAILDRFSQRSAAARGALPLTPKRRTDAGRTSKSRPTDKGGR